MIVSTSKLSGALERAPDGWRWKRTGRPEPRVTDTTMEALLPRFERSRRYGATSIIIADEWRSIFGWSGDAIAGAACDKLSQRGVRRYVTDPFVQDSYTGQRRPQVAARLIALAIWNLVMLRPIPAWNERDLAPILRRAVAAPESASDDDVELTLVKTLRRFYRPGGGDDEAARRWSVVESELRMLICPQLSRIHSEAFHDVEALAWEARPADWLSFSPEALREFARRFA